MRLGGVGSGLFPAGRSGEYWMVTDRGPNGEPKVNGEKRRTFPVPEFAPAIVRVAVRHGAARIVHGIPLKKSDGTPISGPAACCSRNARTPWPASTPSISARRPTSSAASTTLLDPRTIAIANDNDFGMGAFGADGRLVDSGVTSRILTIRLPRPIG